ncbi:DUF3021 domain-containing protein [Boudabousia marimammalium]|uniref:DUF3021 domain-containing protein n=1 Tax=Boudabousia marimammalium TaxID=156892 RepID=A0A1Q5PR55_9ACTO|nr:DUF3021 domain-containing protein [Boudabousia marimammalium]OKL49915.1 hypothetical protein BM477_03135 [Boudabousia marimammalium]
MNTHKTDRMMSPNKTFTPLNLMLGALTGLAIGVTLELVFSFAISNQYTAGLPSYLDSFGNQNVAVLMSRGIYMMLGVGMQLLSGLYDSDRFSLMSATVLHYLGVSFLLSGAGLFLKWVEWGWSILGFLQVTTLIYLCIWVAMWLKMRSQIRKANQKIAERKLS